VAREFIGDIENLEVNHMDGNPLNNHINNLEIVTRLENARHAFNTDLIKTSIKVIVNDKVFKSMAKAANFISCSQSLLSQKLKNGKSKFK
jgi:hypothetical protein